MDPKQIAQALKGAPTPTDQLSKWQKFAKMLAPGLADTMENITTDPMGVMQRNIGRALPTQQEMDYTIQNHGAIPPSEKNKLMAMVLQTVYHGSPANFDKFDMSKVGTGEGAQAYGHGMYFADNPKVARQYQIQNSPQEIEKFAKSIASDYGRHWSDMSGYERQSFIDELVANPEKYLTSAQMKGNLYKVDIPDSQIANMLHWDKPLSEQPQAVKQALKPVLDGVAMNRGFDSALQDKSLMSMTGGDLVQNLNAHSPTSVFASNRLAEVGIPGIKYLDQGSRGAGQGTYNYVVFDPSNLKILGKE